MIEQDWRDSMVVISTVLKDRRIRMGLTNRKVSELTEISEGTISNYENGKSSPTLENLETLAHIYKTTVIDLLSGNIQTPVIKPTSQILNDKANHKLNELTKEVLKEQDMMITNPSLIMIDALLVNANAKELKALYEYCFYPSCKNTHINQNIFLDDLSFYNEEQEKTLQARAYMSFKMILERIRCSKEMGDNIVSWHNTKIKNQEQRIVGEKKEEDRLERAHLQAMMESYYEDDSPRTREEWENYNQAMWESWEDEKQREAKIKQATEQQLVERKNIIAEKLKKDRKKQV